MLKFNIGILNAFLQDFFDLVGSNSRHKVDGDVQSAPNTFLSSLNKADISGDHDEV